MKDYCPVCGSVSVGFDFSLRKFVCQSCGGQWSDDYVLVQFPEDASHFENNGIGYPCFNSDDNGARYIPEYDYISHFKKGPTHGSLFRPVVWPESQSYLHHLDKRCEVVMADEKALVDFGTSAVWVPTEVLKNTEPKYAKVLDDIRNKFAAEWGIEKTNIDISVNRIHPTTSCKSNNRHDE